MSAEFTGRVDVARGRLGFGHLNAYRAQFVVASISDVQARDRVPGYDPRDFSLTPVRFPSGTVAGRVLGPSGAPIVGIRGQVQSVGPEGPRLGGASIKTDAEGRFKVDVEPGTYIVSVNTLFPPSPASPYPRTWAPDRTTETAADRFTVTDTETVTTDIRIANRHTVVKRRVRVVWPDGKPAADANIWLEEEQLRRAVVGGPVAYTSPDGSAELAGLEGIPYRLRAGIHLQPRSRPFCTKLLRVPSLESIDAEVVMVLSERSARCTTTAQ